MTLEEFNKVVSEAAQKAHLFVVNSIGTPDRIRSVSLRVDDDGVLSVLLHTEHTRNRVWTEEAREITAAINVMRQFKKLHPEVEFDSFSNYFVSVTDLLVSLAAAGDEYVDDDSGPWVLIDKLIRERDYLRHKLSPPPKTDPETVPAESVAVAVEAQPRKKR